MRAGGPYRKVNVMLMGRRALNRIVTVCNFFYITPPTGEALTLITRLKEDRRILDEKIKHSTG